MSSRFRAQAERARQDRAMTLRRRVGLLLLCGALGLLGGGAVGCTTRSKARLKAQEAFLAGQQEMLRQQQAQQPLIFVRGDVKHARVPWTQDLTLAQAIVAAEYRGLWEPRKILLLREGQVQSFHTKSLLAGQQDCALLPGDVIELQR